MSYIVSFGRFVAKTEKEIKSGTKVRAALLCLPALPIDGNRKSNLVSPWDAKISNDKKWEKDYNDFSSNDVACDAKEINNEGSLEFLVY